jgi:hypothetical protein
MSHFAFAAIATCVILLTSCALINRTMGFKDGNLVEEIAEDAIELSSGQKVDLSAVKEDKCGN